MPVTRAKLSSSTNGRMIKVAATASPGTALHTHDGTSGVWDEVYLWAQLTSTSGSAILTIEFGGTTSPDDTIRRRVRANDGFSLVVPGLVVTASVVVRAFASSANVVTIGGYVNRIIP